jgi:hypothetical protein
LYAGAKRRKELGAAAHKVGSFSLSSLCCNFQVIFPFFLVILSVNMPLLYRTVRANGDVLQVSLQFQFLTDYVNGLSELGGRGAKKLSIEEKASKIQYRKLGIKATVIITLTGRNRTTTTWYLYKIQGVG